VSSGRIRSDDVLPGSGTDAAVNGSGDACATFGPGWVLVGESEPRAALVGEEGYSEEGYEAVGVVNPPPPAKVDGILGAAGPSGRPSAVACTAAGAGTGTGVSTGLCPPTPAASSPDNVSTEASATHRRRQYTAAGSGPTGSHTHSMYRSDYSEWVPGPVGRRPRAERHTRPVHLPDLVSRWYRVNARDLPWRRPGTTPWGVLVSEFMLQQTPVARVEPIWREWMERWPRPSDLAAAPRADVLRAWGRLGYPRRALRLHEAAQAVAERHGDVVPADVEALEALPGVGSYTARAVAAFGYGLRSPVVDTNVRRVVARAVHGAGDAGPARIRTDLADVDALLPPDDAGAALVSVALMELGAVVCTARAPRCGACPVHAVCAWQLAGRPDYTGPRRQVQAFAGTDRQVRGRLMEVLRGSPEPVERAALDAAWADAGQRDRCLDSLLVDGLAEQLDDGRFALPA
jgi:A/G-specific adenine glycosylase